VDLLDAGCGTGEWALEIAARRPDWRLTGIDKDEDCIAAAQQKQWALGRSNLQFIATDFLAFTPTAPFDVVLAVASTHYLAKQGRGDELLRRFAEWLRPGGTLLLYGPRACEERPHPPLGGLVGGDWGFHAADLDAMVRRAGMVVRELLPQVEYFGAAAKQIASRSGRSRLGRVLTYPVQVALTAVGNARQPNTQSRSVAYLLIAGKPK
jgi:trans-aconitate methyltransferase